MKLESSDRPPLLLGRYALYGEIASGGMATVYFGRLLGAGGFSRTIAVKRLHPQLAKDPDFVGMFLDEARMAARVQHPNVVTTLDVEQSEGELFLIMEYVHGESLSRLIRASIRRGEKVPPRIVATIMVGALHGLHAAHEAKSERGEPLGLVHRDVSPQNVLVGADGMARIIDFGVAKAAGRIQMTREGQIKGKLEYMPPEQLHGERLDRRTDVYAAGVVLWEALVGQRLFQGGFEGPDVVKILTAQVDPPSSRLPGLPTEFDSVTMRALHKNPAERWATAREMALALERCGATATPSEVGAWVELLAADDLARRAKEIAAIEADSESIQSSRSGARAAAVSSSRGLANGTAARETSTLVSAGHPKSLSPAERTTVSGPEPVQTGSRHAFGTDPGSSQSVANLEAIPRRRPRSLSALIACGIAIAGTLVAIVAGAARMQRGGADLDALNASASPAVPPATALMSSVAAAFPRDPPPAPLVTGEVNPAGSAPSASPPPVSTPTAPKAGPLFGSKPAATATTTRKGSCTPPFTIDAAGRKRYKPECI